MYGMENINVESETKKNPLSVLYEETPLSKNFGRILFVVLPFIGFLLGVVYMVQTEVAMPVDTNVTQVTKNTLPSVEVSRYVIPTVAQGSATSSFIIQNIPPDEGYPYSERQYVLVTTPEGAVPLGMFAGCQPADLKGQEDLVRMLPDKTDLAVASHVSCWFAGAGEQIYIYTEQNSKGETVTSVGAYWVQECPPTGACSPHGVWRPILSFDAQGDIVFKSAPLVFLSKIDALYPAEVKLRDAYIETLAPLLLGH